MGKAAAMIMVQCASKEEVMGLEKVFLHLDKTNEGSVQLWELQEALKGASEGSGLKMSDFEIQNIFTAMGYNNDQYIYFSDFLTAVISYKIRDRENGDVLLKATFERMDTDNSGKISMANLESLFGTKFNGNTIQEMMDAVDTDGDKQIDYSEFKKYILQPKSPRVTMELGALSEEPTLS